MTAAARAAPAALVLLAAILRFATLDVQSLWLDEAYTAGLVRRSLGDMLATIPESESTPPAYYVVAWAWTRLFGSGEAGLRSLSALAGTLTVPCAYLIALRIASRRAALLAAGLAAVHPLLVWFSQEARAYALAVLLCSVSVLLTLRLVRAADAATCAAWAAAAALAVATHYFAAFLVVPELCLLVAIHGRRGPVLPAAAAFATAGLALLPLALAQRGTGHAGYIDDAALGTRVLQLGKQFLVGYAGPAQVLTAALAAAVWLVGLGRLLRLRRRPGMTGIGIVAGLAAAMVVVPAVLAVAGPDFLNTRNVLPALPLLLLLVAAGLTLLPRPATGTLLGAGLGLVLLAVTVAVAARPEYQRDDWRDLATALGPAAGARAVVVSPGSGARPLRLYRPGLRPMPASGRPVSEVAVVAIAPRSDRGGMDRPPAPPAAPALPPGFARTAVRSSRTFTVATYRSPAPVAVTPGPLAAAALWPGDAAVLVAGG